MAALRRLPPAQRDGRLQGARVGMTWFTSALLVVLVLGGAALAEPSEAERAARWADLKHAIFGDRVVEDAGDRVAIDAPMRAEDAALVPVAIRVAQTLAPEIRGLYLVIDNNPSPLAAHFLLGPMADPSEIATRVRIDDYTYLHVVAQPPEQFRAADGPGESELHPRGFHAKARGHLRRQIGISARVGYIDQRGSDLLLRHSPGRSCHSGCRQSGDLRQQPAVFQPELARSRRRSADVRDSHRWRLPAPQVRLGLGLAQFFDDRLDLGRIAEEPDPTPHTAAGLQAERGFRLLVTGVGHQRGDRVDRARAFEEGLPRVTVCRHAADHVIRPGGGRIVVTVGASR